MRQKVMWIAGGLLLAGGAALFVACNKASADVGPNGGDVVALPNTDAKAEVIGNADTGEVVVRTWDEELANPRPMPHESLVIGEGDRRLELTSHPMADDPQGRSSRFYGRAEWLRGGRVDNAWIECCGSEQGRERFGWSHGWEAGRRHGDLWREMREHGEGMRERGMGMGMGTAPGAPAGPPAATMPGQGEGMAPEHGMEEQRGMEHMPAGPMGVPPAQASPTPPDGSPDGAANN